ncbi:uncharacterized protein LOC131979289 [Centropristis striata]|uniref:uncharacterized protein LOC131979289 n=1 Tax=Centropristis striata TaxID=184440 RepID=UPI0027E1B67B|nr:uncharacterized protein LOC131979289 [Centropristis striata]
MSQGYKRDEDSLDLPGNSTEMDLTSNPGLVHEQRRVVTRISVGTQTDWRDEDECRHDYKYPNQGTSKAPHKNSGSMSKQIRVSRSSKYHEDGLRQGTRNESDPKNMKSELEISPDNEVLDSLSKEIPRTPAACQGETEESLTNLDKISSPSGSDSSEELLQTVFNICCKHCQEPKKPPVTSDQITNSVDPKEFFCCEEAWKLTVNLLKGAADITKETVTDRDPAMQKDQRLKGLELKRGSDHQAPKAGCKQVPAALHNWLSDDTWTSYPETEIMDSENTLFFNGENAAQKRTAPLVKHYSGGQTFIVIFPDGTGQAYYPSGRLALLLCAAQSADWCCAVVLEDSHLQPHIQALFTSRGQGTCYHSNGSIWYISYGGGM